MPDSKDQLKNLPPDEIIGEYDFNIVVHLEPEIVARIRKDLNIAHTGNKSVNLSTIDSSVLSSLRKAHSLIAVPQELVSKLIVQSNGKIVFK